ncbi:MAG: helix-turn-helix transcriptional regulator [Bacteroidetes bacterium]|nr:helix-turn-helix transcriptional regulator [Bacteroidota bacterium]
MGIGNVIKRLRLIRGYNQKYMASQLGISERQYNNIENEITVKVTEARKKRIAEILEIDSDLLREDGSVMLNFQSNVISGSKESASLGETELQSLDLLVKRIDFMEKQSEQDRGMIKELMQQLKMSRAIIDKFINLDEQ